MSAHGAAQALLPGPQTPPPAASTGASQYANMLPIDAGKPLGLVCVTNQDGGYPFVGAPRAVGVRAKGVGSCDLPGGQKPLGGAPAPCS
jgi:hypothetical protein